MRIVRSGFVAVTLVAALLATACSGEKSGAWAPVKSTPAEIEAEIAALKTEVFQMKADAATDFAPVIAALPKAIAVTYDSAALEPASGATLLSGVRITPSDNTEVGVSIEQLRIWGMDADFAVARLNGQRLDETAPLARRIEAANISAFGLETLMSPAMDAYTGAVEGALLDAIENSSPELDPQLNKVFDDEFQQSLDMELTNYSFNVARLVIDDLVLRPFVVEPKTLPPENGFADLMPIAQTFAAYTRAFAADTVAWYDMTGDMTMVQYGYANMISFSAGAAGTRGLRGGDTDYSFARDIVYDFNLEQPTGATPPAEPDLIDGTDTEVGGHDDNWDIEPSPSIPMRMNGSVASYSIQGLRLDKLYGYLARGVMPARTETDLLSMGPINYKGAAFAMNGRDIYSVGDTTVEVRDFHWLIPASFRLSWTDVVYDFEGIMLFADQAAAVEAGGAPADTIPPEAMAILKRYGFERLNLNGAVDIDWKPKTGVSAFSVDYGFNDLMRFDMKFAGTLPTFKAASDLVPADAATTDQAALSALFKDTSAFKLAEFNLIDEGGLEKGFAAFIEFAALFPDDPGMAFVKGATPASLRQLASSGLYIASHEAAKTVPPAKEVIGAFAEWVAKGGAVHLTAKPKKPLTAADFETLESGDLAAFDLLNMKAVHEPPAAAPAK